MYPRPTTLIFILIRTSGSKRTGETRRRSRPVQARDLRICKDGASFNARMSNVYLGGLAELHVLSCHSRIHQNFGPLFLYSTWRSLPHTSLLGHDGSYRSASYFLCSRCSLPVPDNQQGLDPNWTRKMCRHQPLLPLQRCSQHRHRCVDIYTTNQGHLQPTGSPKAEICSWCHFVPWSLVCTNLLL